MFKQLILILFVFTGIVTKAADIELKATTSHTVVNIGQRFQISYSIDASAAGFKLPSLNDFIVLSGPNQSKSMQYINGRMSASSSWSLILMADKEGVYTIPAASVNVDGEIVQSGPLEIRVVNSAPSARATPGSRPQSNSPKQENINRKDQVFINVSVDKTEVYLGEKITATYKLYTRVGIADNTMEYLPSLNGFWSQDIKSLYDDAKWDVEIVNGMKYNTAVLMNSLLYPQRTGSLKVDAISMKMQIQVSGSGNSLFDRMFGNYETKEVIVKSNEINIRVKALPEIGKPKNFSGAVGSFDVKREFSTTRLKANEALDLKITLNGSGNIQLMDAPELQLPTDFEVYEPEVKDNFNINRNGISGSRTFEYLIIPRHEGEFKLEPFNFSYFDLQSESYKTIVTDSVLIQVEPADKTAGQVYGSINKEEVELLNKDIAYIHEDDLHLRTNKNAFYGSWLFYILLLLPVLGILFFYFYRKRYEESKRDLVGLRKSKAQKIAGKRMRTAKKHLDSGDKKSFHEEISAALFGYYSDKFNLSLSELSQEKIIATMKEKNTDATLIQSLKEILEEADMARFAPPSDMDDLAMYKKAENVIVRTEEEVS